MTMLKKTFYFFLKVMILVVLMAGVSYSEDSGSSNSKRSSESGNRNLAGTAWNATKSGIKDGASSAWESAKSETKDNINFAGETINALGTGSKTTLDSFGQSQTISDVANSAKTGASNTWETMKSGMSNNINSVVSGASDTFNALKNDGLWEATKTGVGAIGNVASTTLESASNTFSAAGNAFVDMAANTAIGKGVSAAISASELGGEISKIWGETSTLNKVITILQGPYGLIKLFGRANQKQKDLEFCNTKNFIEKYKNQCLTCTTVGTVMAAFLKSCAATEGVMQSAAKMILKVMSVLWIAVYILKNISSFQEVEIMKFIQDLFIFLFKVLVAWVCIEAGYKTIMEYTINPIISFGTDFGQGFLNMSANDISTNLMGGSYA